jgi:PAS domain S-box-containing protein
LQNRFALDFFGYTEEEVIGKGISIFFEFRPDLEKDIGLLIQSIVSDPDSYVNMEHENVKSTGKKVWIAYTIVLCLMSVEILWRYYRLVMISLQ